MEVLIITYHYPPERSGGVARAVLLEKFLVKRGHNVTIIAPQDREEGEAGGRVVSVKPWYYGRGTTVKMGPSAGESPPSLVKRLKWRAASAANKIARASLIPDPLVCWAVAAGKTAVKIGKEKNAGLVITTSPPESVNMAGMIASRRLSIPWLADFRDGWLCEPLRPETVWPIRGCVEKWLEAKTFRKASKVSFTSRLTMEDAQKRYPQMAGKFGYFPVGYEPYTGKRAPSPHFNIVYAGKLSASHADRGGKSFFDGVKSALEEQPEIGRDLRIRFIGGFSDAERLSAKPLIDAGVLEMKGETPLDEILEECASASALLSISAAGFKTPVPRKLYDYLSVSRPILALCSGGEVGRILGETRAGFWVEPDDANAIKSALLRLWTLWKDGRLDAEFPCDGNNRFIAEKTHIEYFAQAGLGV